MSDDYETARKTRDEAEQIAHDAIECFGEMGEFHEMRAGRLRGEHPAIQAARAALDPEHRAFLKATAEENRERVKQPAPVAHCPTCGQLAVSDGLQKDRAE